MSKQIPGMYTMETTIQRQSTMLMVSIYNNIKWEEEGFENASLKQFMHAHTYMQALC